MSPYLNIRIKDIIPLASLILINIFLINLPLTNSLGYEFVLVNSLILFLSIGLLVNKKLKTNPAQKIFHFIKSSKVTLIIFLLIPLFLGTISSLLNSRCPINDGLAFYIVILFPSFLLGIILAFLSSSISVKYNRSVFLIITILLLITSLVEFYFLPQVYFYNPLFGFFPGTIYDEDIAVNAKMIMFQLFNLSLFGFALFLLLKLKKKFFTVKSVIIIGGIIFFSVIIKPVLGFSTTKTHLTNELKNKITTEHFNIIIGDSVQESEYEFIALQHEYYYERILEKLEITETPHISSYIFNDKTQKKELFGAGNANVSKPWMNMIFLNYNNYKSALKHEIVHAAAAKFGVTPFKVAHNVNTALIEGFAMFIENDFDGYPVIYGAKLAFNNNYKVSLQDLFNSGKFFTSYSSLSYIYSGAFLEFLSVRFGITKVKQLYAELDFEKAFGENFETLASQFESYLTDSSFSGKQNEAQLYFGGQTIFKKFCARMASNDIKEAQIDFLYKNYQSAAEKYLAVYKYSTSPGSLNGYIISLRKQKKYKKAAYFLEKEIKKFSASQSLYNLELNLADCLLLGGDLKKADYYYNLIRQQNPHQNFANWINLLSLIREYNGIEELKKFLIADETERRNILFNLYEKYKEVVIVPYLLQTGKEYYYKISSIITELKQNFNISGFVSRIVAMDISEYLLRTKDYENAKFFAVKAVENYADDYRKFELVENLRMVNWFDNFANVTNLKEENTK